MINTWGRIPSFLYDIVSYLIFLRSFLYGIAFVGDFEVPKMINSGPEPATLWQALGTNAVLLGLFAVQHSVMARDGFKKRWTKIIQSLLLVRRPANSYNQTTRNS